MVFTGVEMILGMAGIKDSQQLIEIQITHIGSLHQSDRAPEQASTLIGLPPGQSLLSNLL